MERQRAGRRSRSHLKPETVEETHATAIVNINDCPCRYCWARRNAYAGMDEAKAFLDKEIRPLSTLSRADQEKEMQWFIDAAKPFAGMDIKVVSETIDHARV